MAPPSTNRNAMDRLPLRFLDDDLEARYQRQAGVESRNGFLLISIASAVVWAPAAFVLPQSTSLAPELAIPVGLGMSGLSLCVALGRHGPGLDQAHCGQPAIDPCVVGHRQQEAWS